LIQAFFLLIWTAATGHAEGGSKKALLIGVGGYDHVRSLNNPVNDVRLLGERLGAVGFAVESVVDEDDALITGMIEKFWASLKEGDLGLFYFAGHGLQKDGTNILLAKNAEVRSDGTISGGVILRDMLARMERSPSALNTVLLDCCRVWPAEAGTPKGLAPILDVPRRTLIAFSTAANTEALDGEGTNSPFAEALATSLSARPSRGIAIEDIVESAGRLVATRSRNTQNPALYKDLGSEPYWIIAPAGNPPRVGNTGNTVIWRTPGEFGAIPAGNVSLEILNVNCQGGTALMSMRARSRQAVYLELKGAMAYDRQGRYHGEWNYVADGNRVASGLNARIAPDGQFDFQIQWRSLPKDLDGFTTVLISGQTDNADFQIPIRNLHLDKAKQLAAVPLSRTMKLGSISASVVAFERQGNSAQARILFESPRTRILPIKGFTGYDEAGSIYTAGAYGVGRQPALNGSDYRMMLPENQPVLAMFTINGVPQECGGLTRFEVHLQDERSPFSFPFENLPLDLERSQENGQAIPAFVWKSPESRKTGKFQNLGVGLKQVSVSGNSSILEFFFLASQAHRLVVESFCAYLADGTELRLGSHGTPEFLGPNDRNSNLLLPPGQPVCYLFQLDSLPVGADGISVFRIIGNLDKKRFQLDIPRIPLSPLAPQDAKGDHLPNFAAPLAGKTANGVRVELVSASQGAGRCEVVCRITNSGPQAEVPLIGTFIKLPDGIEKSESRVEIGASVRTIKPYSFVRLSPPIGQPLKLIVSFELPGPGIGRIPLWKVLLGSQRNPTVYEFSDIPITEKE
jgi:hypothetical protein